MDLKARERELEEKISAENFPGHVAIIMDGNGRWAKERGLPRREGHRQGVETVRRIVRHSSHLGIKVLTLFAFSTENWRRPAREVNYLMSLPEKYFDSEMPELKRNKVRIKTIGHSEGLPLKVQKALNNGVEETRDNTGMILNFALNYGSRGEILRAANLILEDARKGKIKGRISEKLFARYLYTYDIPDPDLVIRTSGELRLSNFLLWQAAYSELYFVDVYWPDFTRVHLLEAVHDYQRRKRRFGKL